MPEPTPPPEPDKPARKTTAKKTAAAPPEPEKTVELLTPEQRGRIETLDEARRLVSDLDLEITVDGLIDLARYIEGTTTHQSADDEGDSLTFVGAPTTQGASQ